MVRFGFSKPHKKEQKIMIIMMSVIKASKEGNNNFRITKKSQGNDRPVY